MKTTLLLLCSLIVFGFVTGCENDTRKVQQTEIGGVGTTIKVGVIAPLSGPDKSWGENGLSGISTALQLEPLLNNGSKIEIVVEDDQNQPELALKALTKLVHEDKVAAVLIMSNSESVLGLVPHADEYATPILALASTHPDVTASNKYISQLLFDDHFQASVAALYVMDELLIDKAGVVVDKQNPHSHYLAQEFITKFKSIGGEITEINVEAGEEQYIKTLELLQEQSDLNLLYTPLDADLMVGLARALDTIDWHPTMVGSDGLQATFLLQHADDIELVDGMLATDPYGFISRRTEYGNKIRRLYKKNSDSVGTALAAQGAEGTSLLLSAMNRCYRKTDRGCINRMLRSTHDFVGIFGKIDIRHDGKAERPIFINVIDGKLLRPKVKVY